MLRHLICHIYPRACGKWRRAVDHLRQPRRWQQFTGRRLIAVATDETCDSPSAVRAAFGHCGADFVFFQNSPTLQEVATLATLLERVLSEPGITFRCHAKGATHPDGSNPASHVWADVMFSTCLDFPALVGCMLAKHAICGPFRSIGMWDGPGYHAWHFAGSFYWFRNSDAYSRDWRNIQPAFWGAEAWPGIFRLEESGCLFCDRANTQHLYDVEWWKSGLAASYLFWLGSVTNCENGAVPYVPTDSLLWAWLPRNCGIHLPRRVARMLA